MCCAYRPVNLSCFVSHKYIFVMLCKLYCCRSFSDHPVEDKHNLIQDEVIVMQFPVPQLQQRCRVYSISLCQLSVKISSHARICIRYCKSHMLCLSCNETRSSFDEIITMVPKLYKTTTTTLLVSWPLIIIWTAINFQMWLSLMRREGPGGEAKCSFLLWG